MTARSSRTLTTAAWSPAATPRRSAHPLDHRATAPAAARRQPRRRTDRLVRPWTLGCGGGQQRGEPPCGQDVACKPIAALAQGPLEPASSAASDWPAAAPSITGSARCTRSELSWMSSVSCSLSRWLRCPLRRIAAVAACGRDGGHSRGCPARCPVAGPRPTRTLRGGRHRFARHAPPRVAVSRARWSRHRSGGMLRRGTRNDRSTSAGRVASSSSARETSPAYGPPGARASSQQGRRCSATVSVPVDIGDDQVGELPGVETVTARRSIRSLSNRRPRCGDRKDTVYLVGPQRLRGRHELDVPAQALEDHAVRGAPELLQRGMGDQRLQRVGAHLALERVPSVAAARSCGDRPR